MTLVDAAPGLSDISVADTEIGDVRGNEGFFHYNRYSAIDLARSSSFERVWFLFVYGRLPEPAELDAFVETVRRHRHVDPGLLDFARTVGATGQTHRPLIDLRTVLSAAAQYTGMSPLWDTDEATRRENGIQLCAMVPTLLAAVHRAAHGLEPVRPRDDLDTAGYWLHAVTGQEVETGEIRALEQYLVATVEHGFNASTFTARVIASTGADLPSAICGAIGAFSGPLHGGAPDRALDALDAIVARGGPEMTVATVGEVATGWARDELAAGRRLMGFGHAVYRTHDPRSELLREVARGLGGRLAEVAVEVERAVVAVLAEARPDRPRYANVEFYAGVVMDRCGLPREMFTPTFTVSRVVGWTANALEQAHDRHIIRPRATYVGPAVTDRPSDVAHPEVR
ncbi:citrate/2-methylcitrate synthase [Williamsia sterculiae]|uniref:Citrate synthase n=1 Tax=Williamsia sterculiae TaxID=1344003 RepID=A0A1N7DS94_9NOCA|nr:citrate/2-methylcitrate synthase [Williamsia sterculiae]SIR78714.1 citrate synthase [Williamsia sterculiae]